MAALEPGAMKQWYAMIVQVDARRQTVKKTRQCTPIAGTVSKMSAHLLESLQASGEDGILGLQLASELLLALEHSGGGQRLLRALESPIA